MRKVIFKRFIQVILAALILNSVIYYVVTSSSLLKNTRKDLLYVLETVDSTLDYSKNPSSEIKKLETVIQKNRSRFTIIDRAGKVLADTGIEDTSVLDNHMEREEVADAMKFGMGYSRRYSDTLKETLLYVAIDSANSDYILRLATPFSGVKEYLVMLLPAVWLSLLIALAVSAGVADHFAQSITKPLLEISREMLKVNGNYEDLNFEKCQYPEINIIADTTTKMANNVKEYLNRIELERQIRQEFFSNASHELKTPITSIQGYAELLESNMIQDEITKQNFYVRIKQESVNMVNIINDILMISRLETKEAEVIFTDVRISLVLDDVLNSMKMPAAAQEVLIHSECIPVSIYANAQQIKELLGNLISNAVKYNKPGGQVWVNISKEANDLIICVRDNGVGIPEESVGRIFERFYRVDKGRSRKQGGTGLGLSIVKHIVQFYHGTITVESKADEGTEFVVRLPFA